MIFEFNNTQIVGPGISKWTLSFEMDKARTTGFPIPVPVGPFDFRLNDCWYTGEICRITESLDKLSVIITVKHDL